MTQDLDDDPAFKGIFRQTDMLERTWRDWHEVNPWLFPLPSALSRREWEQPGRRPQRALPVSASRVTRGCSGARPRVKWCCCPD